MILPHEDAVKNEMSQMTEIPLPPATHRGAPTPSNDWFVGMTLGVATPIGLANEFESHRRIAGATNSKFLFHLPSSTAAETCDCSASHMHSGGVIQKRAATSEVQHLTLDSIKIH
jgi:hypothetical protein